MTSSAMSVVRWLAVSAICITQLSIGSSQETTDFTNAVNCFSTKFLKQLPSRDNSICSPYSVDVVMSMILFGSQGETFNQLNASLQYGSYKLNDEDIKAGFTSSLTKLSGAPNVILNIDNSFWIEKSFTVKEDYKKLLKETFLAQDESVDFKENPREATDEINNWVNNKTNGLIPKIINYGDVDSLTKVILINAIYFKGNWSKPFDKQNTKWLPFHNNADSKKKVMVELMNQQGSFLYQDDAVLKAQKLALDYVGNKMSFVMLLPHKGVSTYNVENKLHCNNIGSTLMFTSEQFVNVTMPKFSVSSSYNLEDTLTKLNITYPFTLSADLSGIGGNDLQVSKVIQKAEIKVDETGSEAAAVTGGIVSANSIEEPPQYIRFYANKPFLYYIVDKEIGQILFAGKIKKF